VSAYIAHKIREAEYADAAKQRPLLGANRDAMKRRLQSVRAAAGLARAFVPTSHPRLSATTSMILLLPRQRPRCMQHCWITGGVALGSRSMWMTYICAVVPSGWLPRAQHYNLLRCLLLYYLQIEPTMCR
jgi:hypothetical protein